MLFRSLYVHVITLTAAGLVNIKPSVLSQGGGRAGVTLHGMQIRSNLVVLFVLELIPWNSIDCYLTER